MEHSRAAAFVNVTVVQPQRLTVEAFCILQRQTIALLSFDSCRIRQLHELAAAVLRQPRHSTSAELSSRSVKRPQRCTATGHRFDGSSRVRHLQSSTAATFYSYIAIDSCSILQLQRSTTVTFDSSVIELQCFTAAPD